MQEHLMWGGCVRIESLWTKRKMGAVIDIIDQSLGTGQLSGC